MLGIDYSSSDDDEEIAANGSHAKQAVDSKSADTIDVQPMANPFESTNYELTSSSDDEEVAAAERPLQSCPLTVQRSTASADDEKIIGSKVSIFSNPFKEEETKELSQLERHVKMSDHHVIARSADGGGGKSTQQICWTYHKHKKCKFGNRCRFRHDDSNFIDVKSVQKSDQTAGKKRVGITDSLVPPKRALNNYFSQKQ